MKHNIHLSTEKLQFRSIIAYIQQGETHKRGFQTQMPENFCSNYSDPPNILLQYDGALLEKHKLPDI